jgi:hypothetical protein
MRSKVQIPLSANNSLGPAHRRSQIITRSMLRGRFTWVRGLLDRVGTRSGPVLEGFFVIKKKRKRIVFKDI